MMNEVDENEDGDLDEFIEDIRDEFDLWVVIVDPLSATTHWRGRAGRGRQHHLEKVTLKDRQRCTSIRETTSQDSQGHHK